MLWDVLRWFVVFAAAVLVIITGLYLLLGKPLPYPHIF
jgi:hypothetical protein